MVLNQQATQRVQTMETRYERLVWNHLIYSSEPNGNTKKKNQGGLAATFDLAAFGLYMFAPVKKSVNHSKTLTSMREVQRSLARTTREYVFFCS